jgi:hypothetical protein
VIYKNGKNVTAIYKGSTPITKVYKGLQLIWESFKKLIVSGVPPLKLLNSMGEKLVDYKIYGNTGGVGDKTKDYEPYGFKIPVISSGKNIFDMTALLEKAEFTKTQEGYYAVTKFANLYGVNSKIVQDLKKYLKANTTYTISKDIEGCDRLASAEGQLRILVNGEIAVRTSNANGYTTANFTFTQEQIDNITGVYVYGNNSTNPITYKLIQIEEGSTATDYEPFVEPVTTNIYINEPIMEGEAINNTTHPAVIPTFKGTTIISVDTEIQPSNIEVTYEVAE